MIKTKSYYKYLLNLNIKYLSKKHIYTFFCDIINLTIPMRNMLFQLLILENIDYLVAKNLVSMNNIIVPSYGQYLIIFSNNIQFNVNVFEQFTLNCCNLLFKGYFVNNLFLNNLNSLNLFYLKNFMFFFGYLIFFTSIYIQYLSFFRFQVNISIRKLQFNLCKQ